MVNVNGWDVRVVSAPPKRIAAGWLHSASVYLDSDGSHLGTVNEITTAKHGGRERERWVQVGTIATGKRVPNGNLSDLVAAAVLKREGFKPFAPPVAD